MTVDSGQTVAGRTIVRPYGDTTGDGMVQLSFTLPIPNDARAEGAALQLAAKMGLEPAMVVHAKGMGPAFTFFIVYGRVSHLVDLSEVTVAKREFPVLSAAEINLRIRSGLGREMVVLKAGLTGERTDAPPGTVGMRLGDEVLVAAGDEWVKVQRVQVGSSTLPAADALRPGERFALPLPVESSPALR